MHKVQVLRSVVLLMVVTLGIGACWITVQLAHARGRHGDDQVSTPWARPARKMPMAIPTRLRAGSGRNWCSATEMA
jgi:hypothetical protein